MNPPFFVKRVTTPEDMAVVEATIASSLGGEGGKCAFLRSQSFLALRLAALYFPTRCNHAPCVTVHSPTGLVVTLHQSFFSLAWLGTIESVDSIQDAMLTFRPHEADEHKKRSKR
jgi:hypothetical protein